MSAACAMVTGLFAASLPIQPMNIIIKLLITMNIN